VRAMATHSAANFLNSSERSGMHLPTRDYEAVDQFPRCGSSLATYAHVQSN
jgi:hypothetical protein